MAFEQPVKKSSPPVSAGPVAAASQMFSYTGGGPVCTSSPDQSPPVAPPGPAHINPLTREQMQQALLYLIKNDPSFMSVLHEAYVKSLTESFSKR
ncbi:mRNA-decapping enzyme 1B-like [Lingula anatina]|nr:mRNA-decapping enzyme 1B-like [Lingula anatina]|eukprot:XP_013391657.1 mRNA-decapping enzyme 1B-like [Lingula anatina]